MSSAYPNYDPVMDYTDSASTEGRLHEIAGQLQAIKEVLNRLVPALEQAQHRPAPPQIPVSPITYPRDVPQQKMPWTQSGTKYPLTED